MRPRKKLQVLPIQPVGIATCVPVPLGVTCGALTASGRVRKARRNSGGNRADAELEPMNSSS